MTTTEQVSAPPDAPDSPDAGQRPSPRRLLGARLAGRFDTPGRLRMGLVAVVSLCLVSAMVGVGEARSRVSTIREIDRRSAPLSVDAVDLYQSMARADAAAATEFLPGGPPNAAAVRAAYDEDIAHAADRLALAATRAGEEGLAADRIADISAQLLVYTGLVEAARSTGMVTDYLKASALMQSTILRRAQALQRYESQNLNEQYAGARAVPTGVLALGIATLGVLVFMQLSLARRTRRVLNLGLLAATAAVAIGFVWWTFALRASYDDLERSRRHSQSVTDALGQAQIAAFQARADEMLALIVPDGSTYEQDLSAKVRTIIRADGSGGVGGAFGAAFALATGSQGRERVEHALDAMHSWVAAHREVRALHDNGRNREAVALAADPSQRSSADAFTNLDKTLAGAVDAERSAFSAAIHRAEGATANLVVATIVLMLLAGAAGAAGVIQRLAEYL